mmetsp:Transcript_37812/g.70979  ORF Transcript_37812/g.70979 Transcript_37812/m.70979 type:complete len:152 (+) Transcript_37812:295-750(+)
MANAETYFDDRPENAKQPRQQRKNLKHNLIMALISNAVLREMLTRDCISDLVDLMVEVCVHEGDTVCESGEVGDHCFAVETGKYKVVRVDRKTHQEYFQKFITDGSFGEEAVLSGSHRPFRIVACEPGILWALAKEDFTCVLKRHRETSAQ